MAESGTEKSKENSVVPPPEISLVDDLWLVIVISTLVPLLYADGELLFLEILLTDGPWLVLAPLLEVEYWLLLI